MTPVIHRYLVEELGMTELVSVYSTGTKDTLLKMPFVQQPGASFRYGYSLDWLALVIEKISGLTIEDYFQKHIFAPLGIHDTSFKPDDKTVNLAIAAIDGKLTYMPTIPISQKASWGGAGLSGSPASYIKIIQSLLPDAKTRVLKKETVDEMLLKPKLDAGQVAPLHMLQSFLMPHFFAEIGVDPASVKSEHSYGGAISPDGTLAWSGAASTYWYLRKDLVYIVFINMMPVYSQKASKLLAAVQNALTSADS